MLFKENYDDFLFSLVTESSGEAWLQRHKSYCDQVRVGLPCVFVDILCLRA